MNIHYLAYAIALFLVLRFLSGRLNSIPANRNIHKLFLRVFPLFEFVIWLAFALWALSQMFGEYQYYNLLISASIGCIVLILGWYFVRDFVAGIILKTEIPFENNQRIRTPQTDGILRKMGYRSLEIESDSGELVKIPYSQLATSSIHLQNIDESMQGHETQVNVSSLEPIQEVKDRLIKEVLLLPWASITHQPSVKVTEQAEHYNVYSVHFHALSDRHAAFICQHLKSCFEKDL